MGDDVATEGRDRGGLRASDADRERVIGTLKTAFVQGRLTEDELSARADDVYASRTYAELAEVTADIPAEPGAARPPRDPWRATKIAWRIEYSVFVPGIVGFLLLPGGPHTSVATVISVFAVSYLMFWVLAVVMMVAGRHAKRLSGQPPPGAEG